MSDNEDYVIVWEAPKIIPTEFRLYYDEQGRVVTYTCEKPRGNFIIIDALTFAEGRFDVKVINGKLVRFSNATVITRLGKDPHVGIRCAEEDINLVVDDSYDGVTNYWKLQIYEL